MKSDYNHQQIEEKWQTIWEKNKTFQIDLDKAKNPYYNLMMFPYPSAEGLHVGNMYAFCGSDIWGRYMRHLGFDVFEPIGLDGFGIHSENYAIKVGKHPKKQAQISQKNFYRQLRLIGNQYSWDNRLETYDPDYYKWTQWIFTRLFKAGLAYRKKSGVNWCPSCKTVLADEQVIKGRCERCESVVKQKKLDQWFFKITDYADKLLSNLAKIDWVEKVKIAQENWIGKSEGLIEKWPVIGMDLSLESFTTWPHTTWGATFMVIAPEHPVIKKLVKGTKYEAGAKKFIKEVLQDKLKDPNSAEKEKKGYFLGRYVKNHLAGHKMPLYIANFAVMEYGTGIVKCTPTHDQRDFEFAQKFDLPMIVVVNPRGKKLDPKKMTSAYTGPGIMSEHTAKFKGMPDDKAREAVASYSIKLGHGKRKVQYHLRDWLISRQRYWGPPIPMIRCKKCGWQTVPDKDLPVLLPEVKDWRPKGTGRGPLAQIEDWVKTKCPKCNGPAERETDVSDTFLDSAWYHLRYPSVKDKKQAWEAEITKKWLPVDMYIGGAEHSVLHLLYARFLSHVFKDLGLLSFSEPYTRFRAHGLVIKDGKKMSKSKGNIVVPDKYIKKYGADSLRCYLMFVGPYAQGGDFRDTGMAGMHRFLTRVYRLSCQTKLKTAKEGENKKVLYFQHKTIEKVTQSIKRLKYNTAISALMEYVNFLQKQKSMLPKQKSVSKKSLTILACLLSPFAPHLTEEIWQKLQGKKDAQFQNFSSVHLQPWPKHDKKYLDKDKQEIVVQVNGKVRERLQVKASLAKDKEKVLALALASNKIKTYLKAKKPEKTIFLPGKLLNLVV